MCGLVLKKEISFHSFIHSDHFYSASSSPRLYSEALPTQHRYCAGVSHRSVPFLVLLLDYDLLFYEYIDWPEDSQINVNNYHVTKSCLVIGLKFSSKACAPT